MYSSLRVFIVLFHFVINNVLIYHAHNIIRLGRFIVLYKVASSSVLKFYMKLLQLTSIGTLGISA